jgi:hypothetical protein
MKGSKTVPASEQCVRTADMKPHPGVYRRPVPTAGNPSSKHPTDLRHLFASQWACRVSLGTAELAEANAKAAPACRVGGQIREVSRPARQGSPGPRSRSRAGGRLQSVPPLLAASN